MSNLNNNTTQLEALLAKVNALPEAGGSDTSDAYIKNTEKGVANGVATLDSNGRVPTAQLPSYVDDVIEGKMLDDDGINPIDLFYSLVSVDEEGNPTFAELGIEGEFGKIYVDITTNKSYRWSGTVFVEISKSLALGDGEGMAFPSNRGKALEELIHPVLGGEFPQIYTNFNDDGKCTILTLGSDERAPESTEIYGESISMYGPESIYVSSTGDNRSGEIKLESTGKI